LFYNFQIEKCEESSDIQELVKFAKAKNPFEKGDPIMFNNRHCKNILVNFIFENYKTKEDKQRLFEDILDKDRNNYKLIFYQTMFLLENFKKEIIVTEEFILNCIKTSQIMILKKLYSKELLKDFLKEYNNEFTINTTIPIKNHKFLIDHAIRTQYIETFETVKWLIDVFDIQLKEGYIPSIILHHSVNYGNIELINYILKFNPNPFIDFKRTLHNNYKLIKKDTYWGESYATVNKTVQEIWMNYALEKEMYSELLLNKYAVKNLKVVKESIRNPDQDILQNIIQNGNKETIEFVFKDEKYRDKIDRRWLNNCIINEMYFRWKFDSIIKLLDLFYFETDSPKIPIAFILYSFRFTRGDILLYFYEKDIDFSFVNLNEIQTYIDQYKKELESKEQYKPMKEFIEILKDGRNKNSFFRLLKDFNKNSLIDCCIYQSDISEFLYTKCIRMSYLPFISYDLK
jgi:hypothetical protein